MSVSLATKARWFGLLWSIGTSCVVALTIQAVPALVVPVLASLVALVAPWSGRLQRVVAAVASLALLGFLILAILSVGWFYLPSVIASVIAWVDVDSRSG